MKNKIVVYWIELEEISAFGNVLKEMKVLKSNHPRFIEGSKFDFGFLEIANRQGYDVEVLSCNF